MTKLRAFLLLVLLGLWPASTFAQAFGTINFDFDSAQLDAQAQAEVRAIAERLKAAQSYKPTVVVGYTDAVGSTAYNDSLGLRRARAVANALVALGVPVDRVGTVESRGEHDLLVQVASAERMNRRVTVRMEDILAACQSYRDVQLDASAIGPVLQQDMLAKLQLAVQQHDSLSVSGANGPAYQMAAAAREDCSIATGFRDGEQRKMEYSRRCLCSSARLATATGNAP